MGGRPPAARAGLAEFRGWSGGRAPCRAHRRGRTRPPRRRPSVPAERTPGSSSHGQQQRSATGCRGGRSPGTRRRDEAPPSPEGKTEASPLTMGGRGRERDTYRDRLRLGGRRPPPGGGGGLRRSSRGAPGPRSIGKRPSDRRGPGRIPGAAKCVRSVDDQCVLQFTLVLAASCVLHRRTSRVIHR